MKTFKEYVKANINEGKELPFTKINFMKIANQANGITVFGTGGGYADTKEFSVDKETLKKIIDKEKLEMLFNNAKIAVKGAKDPKMKGRTFMIRIG